MVADEVVDHNNNNSNNINGECTVPEFCNQIVDTTGLHVEEAYDVKLDPEVEALLKMSKRGNTTQKTGTSSPIKAPRTQGRQNSVRKKKRENKTELLISDESTGEAVFFDLDDTVLNDESGSSHNMSTDDKDAHSNKKDGGFFYHAGTADRDHGTDSNLTTMEYIRIPVSYTHLTLPTTPYV